jgi:hypothetical protein
VIDSTLKFLAVTALFALGACSGSDTNDVADSGLPDSAGWQLASGKLPTKAEFAALAASCQDRGGAFEPCLTELGLKRAP